MEVFMNNDEKVSYQKPEMKKHEPIKIVQGSGCAGLYYTSLYYYH